MIRYEDGCWPLDDVPEDPWAERWPDDDLGWADRASVPWLPAPDPVAYRDTALAFQAYVDAARRGAPIQVAHLQSVAAELGFSPRWRVDRRPRVVGARRFSEEEAARIALDFEPASGLIGLDAMLGPWVELLPPERRSRTWVNALGHWAAARSHGERPLRAWANSKPEPPPSERAAANTVSRAPLGVWRLREAPDGWVLEDLAGISPHRRPEVAFSPIPAAGVGALEPGATLLARAFQVGTTWTLWGPLLLPALDPSQVRAAVYLEMLALRLRDRRVNLEDALRRSAHHVARALHLVAWAQAG